MAIKPGTEAKVVPLFKRGPQLDNEPEISIRLPPTSTEQSAGTASAVKLDLADKPKALFLIGPGGSGKTMLARWVAGRMNDAGRTAVIAALDPQNRSLATWFDGVAMPETSDGAQTSRWLRDLLKFLMDSHHSGMLDFGGGDTALARTVESIPDLASTLQQAGVEPVAIYTLTPRQDDLASLESLEASGFQPRATILVFNEGRVDSLLSRDEAFARVMRHSALQGAIRRGAVPIWMPRLEPEVAQEIEGKRLQFIQARDGIVPEGQTFGPLGGFERGMVRRWMDRMEKEFAPVTSWLL